MFYFTRTLMYKSFYDKFNVDSACFRGNSQLTSNSQFSGVRGNRLHIIKTVRSSYGLVVKTMNSYFPCQSSILTDNHTSHLYIRKGTFQVKTALIKKRARSPTASRFYHSLKCRGLALISCFNGLEPAASIFSGIAAEALNDVGIRPHLSLCLLLFASVIHVPNNMDHYSLTDPRGMHGWVDRQQTA